VIFNFFLGNQSAGALNWLADVLLPIQHTLADAGHHVIGFGTGLLDAPAVNVLVEGFESDAFTGQLLATKAERGRKLVYGVLCPEDVAEGAVAPQRRANLLRVVAAADFVWSAVPQAAALSDACPADRFAFVEFGFCERFLDRYIVGDTMRRDLDAIIYGSETPYRRRIADDLKQRGLTCFVSDREAWPNFMTDDLIRRAKVLIDVRRDPQARFLGATRINKALHAGTAVVSERFDQSALAKLYGYVDSCPVEEIAGRCVEIIRGGKAAEVGLAALGRFRAETSMATNIGRALSLPIFVTPG
jgi:hypothetical protein